MSYIDHRRFQQSAERANLLISLISVINEGQEGVFKLLKLSYLPDNVITLHQLFPEYMEKWKTAVKEVNVDVLVYNLSAASADTVTRLIGDIERGLDVLWNSLVGPDFHLNISGIGLAFKMCSLFGTLRGYLQEMYFSYVRYLITPTTELRANSTAQHVGVKLSEFYVGNQRIFEITDGYGGSYITNAYKGETK
jgi:hypothetical protein